MGSVRRGIETCRSNHYHGVVTDWHAKLPRSFAWSLRLRFSRPPGFDDLCDEEFVRLLRQRLAAREAESRAQSAAEGRRLAGVDAIRNVDWNAAARTRERRRVRDPHLAGRAPDTRVTALRRR